MLTTLFLGSLLFSCALGWGDEGHRAVAEIAYQELVPRTRDTVDRLLKAHNFRNLGVCLAIK
jgi:hypothetical protein